MKQQYLTLEMPKWIQVNGSQGALPSLHAQWPRLQREQRDEVAKDLWNDPRWQQSEPEVAVVEWLRQGIPAPIGSEQQ